MLKKCQKLITFFSGDNYISNTKVVYFLNNNKMMKWYLKFLDNINILPRHLLHKNKSQFVFDFNICFIIWLGSFIVLLSLIRKCVEYQYLFLEMQSANQLLLPVLFQIENMSQMNAF